MKKKFEPASAIQDIINRGEYAGVNTSISDSSTYIFNDGETMDDVFSGENKSNFLYSRHLSPSNKFLAQALAKMENTPKAAVTSSGMAAITATIMQICSQGDHIIAARTIYGGTYALLKNFISRFGIQVTFVDINNIDQIKNAIKKNTKIIYCESLSNPLLELSNIPEIAKISKKYKSKLIVDNTFSPLIFSPANMGADIVIHSLTKYINGMSDGLAGCICGSVEFIDALYDVNSGAAMLMGPVLDSFRAANILKNMNTLSLRMIKHSQNAFYITNNLSENKYKIIYPGLKTHKHYELFCDLKNINYSYGGLFIIDMHTASKANELMSLMIKQNIGALAVSLGWHKTLFCAPGESTSSEIPVLERKEMGLSEGLVRVSIGLDADISRTYLKILSCLEQISFFKKNY